MAKKKGKKMVGYNPDEEEIVQEEQQKLQKLQPFTKGRKRAEMLAEQQKREAKAKAKQKDRGEEEGVVAEEEAVQDEAQEDVDLTPVKVQYCPMCRMPVEYCEFSNVFETKCEPYLQEALPDLLEQLLQLRESDKFKSKKVSKKKTLDESEVTEVTSGATITVAVTQRTKRKWVTLITGLEAFHINAKELSKTLSKKFSSGASVVKKPETGIECQGDYATDIFNVLCVPPYNVPKKAIKVVVKKKKTKEEKMEAALERQAQLMLGGREAVEQMQEEDAGKKKAKPKGSKKRRGNAGSDSDE